MQRLTVMAMAQAMNEGLGDAEHLVQYDHHLKELNLEYQRLQTVSRTTHNPGIQ